MFMACHPVLAKEARVALTLRVLGGLTTEEIARAFLVPVSTIAQRIVRAKRTLSEARVRFEVPGGAERLARLASVLEVIYLIFNEGYSGRRERTGSDLRSARGAPSGPHPRQLDPAQPEVHGLVALMEIQASRLGARVGPSGDPSSCSIRIARAGIHSLSGAAGGARARREIGRCPWSVRAASSDRRLPCASNDRGGDGLAAHRGAL